MDWSFLNLSKSLPNGQKEFDDEYINLNDEQYISHLVHKYNLKYKLISLNNFFPKLPQDYNNKIAI
jgi:hypothetical protein